MTQVMRTQVVGIDFGTTNSVVSVLDQTTGQVRTARFRQGATASDVFRTLLCFWTEQQSGRQVLCHAAGPDAITAYLDDPLDSRLVMSLKTYLASGSFTDTNLFGRRYTLEQLVAVFLRALSTASGVQPGVLRIVAGRPVRFAGESADDALGEARLRAAYAEAGYHDIDVALEPEAAGYRFARTLDGPATVLIGDFGGGTSDFSVLRFEPGSARPVTALGQAGVGIAGDAFDLRIMDQVVAPLLGKGSTYAPMGNALPVPPEWYAAFTRWHRLSLMRSPRTLRDIAEVARTAQYPDRLAQLSRLIQDGQGYPLYQAVSAVKAELSSAPAAALRFQHAGFSIDRSIARAEFEQWIAPDLARVAAAVDQALANAGVAERRVDRVFLTGGTAFVPAVRRLFEQRFGAALVSGGGEFVSVAEGLALIGRDRLND